MPSHIPLFLQRLSSELQRRLELAEAGAREARRETHALQALDLVALLENRMPFDDAVGRYLELMDLGSEESEIVRTRALVLLGARITPSDLTRERDRSGWNLDWRYATPLGAVRFLRRHLRRNAEEDLWMEFAAARAEEALIVTHVKHARIFVRLLDGEVPPPRSVSIYLDRLEVPAARARSVYQRTLAQLAERYLPRSVPAAVEQPSA